MNRILAGLVAGALLGTAAGAQMPAGGPPMMQAQMAEMMGSGLAAACVADPAELGISAEAAEAFEARRFETRKKVIRAMADLQILRLELSQMLGERGFDLTAAQKKVGEIAVKESAIRTAHVEALYALAGLVTDEQWERLRAAEKGASAGPGPGHGPMPGMGKHGPPVPPGAPRAE